MTEPTPKPRKFKVGDRVRCIDDRNIVMLSVGEDYDVIAVHSGNEFNYVCLRFNSEDFSKCLLNSDRFELVTPEYDPLEHEG